MPSKKVNWDRLAELQEEETRLEEPTEPRRGLPEPKNGGGMHRGSCQSGDRVVKGGVVVGIAGES